jgi:hypothetical protein
MGSLNYKKLHPLDFPAARQPVFLMILNNPGFRAATGVTLPAVALAKAGMVTWLHACPDFSGVTCLPRFLGGYMVTWLHG